MTKEMEGRKILHFFSVSGYMFQVGNLWIDKR